MLRVLSLMVNMETGGKSAGAWEESQYIRCAIARGPSMIESGVSSHARTIRAQTQYTTQ